MTASAERDELILEIRELLYGRMDGEMNDFMTEEATLVVDVLVWPRLEELSRLKEKVKVWRGCDCWEDCHCKDLHALLEAE